MEFKKDNYLLVATLKGHTVYDANLKNYSLKLYNSGLDITTELKQFTISFVDRYIVKTNTAIVTCRDIEITVNKILGGL